MIVVMKHRAAQQEVEMIINKLKQAGMQIHLSQGVEHTIIGAVGDRTRLDNIPLEAMPGVEKVIPIACQYKLASRTFKEDSTVVKVRDLPVGGLYFQVMAGPCAVESRAQLLEAAEQVRAGGGTILRGGAFKPRTSPYSFQGLEEEGLKLLAEARDKTNLPVVTEVMDAANLPLVLQYADMLQIGARNMQNYSLLRELGKVNKPVLLKRAPSATIEEWLMAAEYILAGGNQNVILCERGIKSFETYTRNTLDLTAVAVAKHLSHLPVIVDPSHAIGNWRFVHQMSLAAVAAGADGLMIEVHPNPAEALCDGAQSLTPDNFKKLMADIKTLLKVVGKKIG